MFKSTERWWNAHTPRVLHNGTKENIIFQVIMTVVFLTGFYAREKYLERRWLENYNKTHGNN